MSGTKMLWEVHHKWPSGTRFALNFCYHWSTLVIREINGTGHFIHSKEVET